MPQENTAKFLSGRRRYRLFKNLTLQIKTAHCLTYPGIISWKMLSGTGCILYCGGISGEYMHIYRKGFSYPSASRHSIQVFRFVSSHFPQHAISGPFNIVQIIVPIPIPRSALKNIMDISTAVMQLIQS